jgi:phosphatidylglycerophosphatase C
MTTAVAAFDFDGTLTAADTFMAFLRFARGPRAAASALARAAVSGTLNPGGLERRDAIKANVIAGLLTGAPLDELADAGRRYGAVAAAQVTPEMLELVDQHRSAGHRIVIVSASLELYLKPAAELLDIGAVLATRLEVGTDGNLTGRFEGANCRGPEKLRRLSEWIATFDGPDGSPPVWAYGNSSGDAEMMRSADVATRARRGRLRRGQPEPLVAPG